MPSFRVAVVGGGVAGLCLAASLTQLNATAPADAQVHVDLYEASPEFDDVGAGLTLWGRVCDALRHMRMADDCVRAAVVVAKTDGFVLRGFRDDADYGRLPLKDAWSLHRVDLIHILARRVPRPSAHLSKRLVAYHDPNDPSAPVTLTFSDGSTATCDVLVGADGLRSAVRAQMMRDAAYATPSLTAHIHPRFTGTRAYRALLPLPVLRARNPAHPILRGGVIYFGKSQHVVGYPISATTLNLAINVTNLAEVDTDWRGSMSHAQGQAQDRSPPSSHHTVSSRTLDRAAFQREVAPRFEGWGGEVADLVESIDTCIEWPIMDLNPLPFYTRGSVVLMGDAAHAAVPYVGAGAAFAIEDAYILSHLLHVAAQSPHPHADATTPLPRAHALHTYQALRRPPGNALVVNARLALRSFQFDGPCGTDMRAAAGMVCDVFKAAAGGGVEGVQGGGRSPEEDMKWGVARVQGLV